MRNRPVRLTLLMALTALFARRNSLARLGVLITLLMGPLSAVAPAHALATPSAPDEPFAGKATITVNTTADERSPDVDPQSAGSKCSLREAMQAMYGTEATGNLGCGIYPSSLSEFEIKFASGGVYKITRDEELPYVNKKLTMDAPGVTIDGGSQGFGRHFGIFIVVGGSLYLKNMTIQNGSAIRGGAIWSKAGTTVVVDKMKFKDNDAAASETALSGGAILSENGYLTVTESIFENNVAVGEGGAIDTNNGYIYKSKFIDNQSSQGGGAIHVRPSVDFLTIHDSEFKKNMTRPIPFYAPATGYEERFDPIGGGAIQNAGRLILLRVTVDGNITELNRGGGGLSNEAGGEAIVTDSVFTKNRANAKGSGDSNTFIKYGFGGAIYNAGQLTLIRDSLHKNEGDIGGGIFNHKPGKAIVVNTTISSNTGWFHGGVVNEHFLFDLNVGGAEVRLYHSTIAKNKTKNEGMSNNLYSSEFKSIWVSNSIVDTGCERTVYSFGHNLFGGACDTFPAPNEFGDASYTVDAGSDLTNTRPVSLGLSPLGNNGGPIPNFLSHDLVDGSYAMSAGRNDKYGCEYSLVGKLDQIQNPRGQDNTACDIGAMEGESDPPKFESNPKAGPVDFPTVNLVGGGPGTSQAVIDISNAGGGALIYTSAFDGQFNSTFLYANTPADGTLYKNQHALITLTCTPPGPGNFWRGFKIKTNIPDQPTIYFKLHCVGVGNDAVADVSQEPGNVNMGTGEPGAPVSNTFVVRNPSPKALNVNYSWADQGNGVWELVGSKFAMAQAQEGASIQSAASPANVSAAVTLQPGENLKLDAKCTPNRPGVFVNTLVLQTNDATHPTVQYDVACEGAYAPAPEKLQPSEFYDVPALFGEGIGISPDGRQVVYGTTNSANINLYSRNASTGKLTATGFVAATGMSGIYDLKYSNDGKNLYQTSFSGDGIVTYNRSENGVLSVSQVITSSTKQRLCQLGQFFVFCGIGTMDGAFAMAVSPDDKQVYVAGYNDGSLTAFVRNLSTGALSYMQRYTRTINGEDVLGGADRVVVSPDGQNVYVTARGDGTLSVFGRNADGTLVFQTAYQDGTNGIDKLGDTSDLVVSPDGKYLYATAWHDDAINVFKRGEDGELQLQEVIAGIDGAYGIALSHDLAGSRAFVTLFDGSAVQVYGRDASTGKLTFLEGYTDTIAGNVNSPIYVVPSPDDMQVYVSLYSGHGVRLFETVKPQPVLASISPASALAGSEDFTLTVQGARFYSNSTSVVWNGTPMQALYISPNEMQVQIPAANIASASNASVLVRNTAPGGGDSTGVGFVVTAAGQPAVPSIESLDPPAATFFMDALNVLVNGANFAPNAQVLLNNYPISTLFVNTTTLLIKLSAAELDQAGASGLVVVNGVPTTAQAAVQSVASVQGVNAPSAAVAAASAVFRFETAAPGSPAIPFISDISPGAVLSGSAGTWVTVRGNNFANEPSAVSVARWNGQPRESAVLSAEEMLVLLTVDDLAVPGPGKLTILTPGAPGAGESSPATFIVLRPGENPVPTADSFALDLEGGVVKLIVSGSDFVTGTQVLLNGVPHGTPAAGITDVLSADLSMADFNAGGAVQMVNPGPSGGTSNALVLEVLKQFVPQLRK